MHSVFTRPWKWGTIVIVIVLVLGLPLAISSYLNYLGLIHIEWGMILGISGAAIYFGAWKISEQWKPATLLASLLLIIVALALALYLEPRGQFTYNDVVGVFLTLGILTAVIEGIQRWRATGHNPPAA